jgi:hypothetical protein
MYDQKQVDRNPDVFQMICRENDVVEFCRKPGDWEDISSKLSVRVLRAAMGDLWNVIPKLGIEIFQKDPEYEINTFTYFVEGFPFECFIVTVKERTYLINTEGFNYCRYACRLI